jgi:hypothetical protein
LTTTSPTHTTLEKIHLVQSANSLLSAEVDSPPDHPNELETCLRSPWLLFRRDLKSKRKRRETTKSDAVNKKKISSHLVLSTTTFAPGTTQVSPQRRQWTPT